MHDAVVSASLRLKLTYDGLAHYAGVLGREGNLRPRRPPREYLGEYTS